MEFEKHLNLPTLAYVRIVFYNSYSDFKNTTSFYNTYSYNITNLILHSFILTFTSTIPITPTDTETYFPSVELNITSFVVSLYDSEKHFYFRQFSLINVKQCTEAPSNIHHANVKARVYVRAKAKRIKAYKSVAHAKKEENLFPRLR